MDGVEILNNVSNTTKDFVVVMIILFMFLTFFIICAVLNYNAKVHWLTFFCSLCALLCVVFGMLICIFETKGFSKHYEVTISDEVKFVEFNERYKIIKQDGKIFTVEERE